MKEITLSPEQLKVVRQALLYKRLSIVNFVKNNQKDLDEEYTRMMENEIEYHDFLIDHTFK